MGLYFSEIDTRSWPYRRRDHTLPSNHTFTKDMMQTFLDKMKEILQPMNGPPVRQQYGNPPGRRLITCYGCEQQGHIIRDCPNRASKNAEKNTEIKELGEITHPCSSSSKTDQHHCHI